MTSAERWLEVQRVVDGALDRAVETRAAFIAERCGDDPDLFGRVRRLVDACERAERQHSMLAAPAAELALPMLADLAALEERQRTALMETLKAALSSRYTVEREIGRGGMSVVFLAHDVRHDRAVAVKVLAREMVAGESIDRFLREIRVTAQLNHPHILPVHDSGEVEGLPYYVMPYVEGETLRARLNSDAPLSLLEIIRLLRELADALSFAHARGVVHRDLKPENVLLSGGHVVVGDFGIAQALTDAADTGALPGVEPGAASYVLGTPGYMAPEQVNGATPTDHRCDLYAFGLVAYELLAGVHPFHGRSRRAMMKAQLDEMPEPLGRIRPDLPVPVVSLVMQCLAKSPAGRPATADEVLALLDESRRQFDAGSVIPHRRRRRALIAGVAATGVLAIGAASWLALRPEPSLIARGVLGEREPLVVADFRVTGADSGIGPTLGRMFGRYLGESRVITVLPQSRIDSVLRLMRRSPGTPLDPVVAREVAQRAGGRAVVTGDVARLGRAYVVTVRLISTATGEELAYADANAANDDAVIPVLGRLGGELRGRIGETLREVEAGPPLRTLTTTSLAALRSLSAATPTVDFERRVAMLREAIALDSTFAYAYLALANSLTPVRRSVAARDSALARAYHLRDHLTQMERTAVTAFYWNLPGRDRRQTIAAYEAQVARDSTDWRSILNLSLSLNDVRRFARSDSLMRRYERIVAWRGLLNLAAAQVGQGNVAAADSTNDRLERQPGMAKALWLQSRATVALAALRLDSAALLTRMWRATPHPNSTVPPLEVLTALARTRGRLGEAWRLASEAEALSSAVGMPPSVLGESIAAASDDLWLRGRPTNALQRLDSLHRDRPFTSLGSLDERMYALRAAALYAASGRPERARSLLLAIVKDADSESRRAMHSQHQLALAEIALAEGRPQDAMAAFRRGDVAADGLPVSSCVVCILPGLARAAERAGWKDSALTLWERYVSTPSPERLESDSWFLAMAYRELRRLHAHAGNGQRSVMFGRRLTDLWRNADPGLLESESGRR